MSLKSKYDAVNRAMGIGGTNGSNKKAKPVKMDTTPAHETAIAKALRLTSEALNLAEDAVHDSNPQTIAAAKRALAVAQKHHDAAYKANQKKAGQEK